MDWDWDWFFILAVVTIISISGSVIARRISNELIAEIVRLIADFLTVVCLIIYFILDLDFHVIQEWKLILFEIWLVAMGWRCKGYWNKIIKSYKMYKESKICN